MSNTPLPPAPSYQDAALSLRHLALSLMDAADLYDQGRGEEGRQRAQTVAGQVLDLVTPTAH